MRHALQEDERPGATERWEHGRLVEVVDEQRLAELSQAWGERRTLGARVGAVATPAISASDREAMTRFCERGWQRSLVQAFEHVGCKAYHVGVSEEALRDHGTLGAALLEARGRHRLAVLEDLLVSRGGRTHDLFAELDALDQSFDAGLGDSWLLSNLPEHCANLWPMRNLARLADRRGVILRDMNWQDYERESSYAPEVPVLALEPRIYGAGVEHDITHYLEPVFWTQDQLLFEVANNGIEGDGQAMNNLILSSWYKGPAYEGYAGWPGAKLFEWLERAFQVASFPEMFGALRTFTIVMHKRFAGDPVEKLRSLAPNLVEGPHLQDLLSFFPEYVQHDHDFLGVLHKRYVTPFYDEWRATIGFRLTFDLEQHVETANDFLWEHQDVDLRCWWHPGIGEVGAALARCRHVWTRALELAHLASVSAGLREATPGLISLVDECEAMERALLASADELEDLTLRVPPQERDEEAISRWSARVASDHERVESVSERLRSVANTLRAQARSEPPLHVEIPSDFPNGFIDLFSNVYYTPAVHEGTDQAPSGVSLDGARLGRSS